MTTSADLRAEVLERLRALEDAHPERRSHMAYEVAMLGRIRSISTVLRALDELREDGRVDRVGERGWRVRPAGVSVQMEMGDG